MKMQNDDPHQLEYEAERHAMFFTDPTCRHLYKVACLQRVRHPCHIE